MKIVADGRVMEFVSEQVKQPFFPPYTCLGIERNGKIVAGCVFNCYTRNDIQLTAAGKGWTKGFLRQVYAYIYDQLGCLRMTVTTEQPEVVLLAERLGGKVEGLMRNFFGEGRDAFIMGILKEDWKYRDEIS